MAEYLRDGIQRLHRILKDAEANDTYEKTYVDIYELDSVGRFNTFQRKVCPKKNTMIVEWTDEGETEYWIVDSCSISKRSPMPGGKIQLEVTIKLRFLRNEDDLLPVWKLPAFNFRMSSASNEESTTVFYPGEYYLPSTDQNGENRIETYSDEYYPPDDNPKPFVNTAGVMLEGSATYQTTQMSFSYCVRPDDFDRMQNWFWALPGTINADQCVICGFSFSPRTLRIDSLSAEFSTVQKAEWVKDIYNEPIIHGDVKDFISDYYRIDASFVINPRTWNQRFLNVGTHVNRNGSILRIWNWSDPATGLPTWGTYADYRMAGGVNGEAITEPVALNSDGDGVMGLDANGRMEMSYRVGSLYRPIAFQDLAFPSAYPIRWNFG